MTATTPRTVQIIEWKPFERNTLRGFLTIALPSGMVLHDCTLHVKNGSKWIGLPSQKFEGKDGKTGYKPIVEFVDRATAEHFRDVVIQALKEKGLA